MDESKGKWGYLVASIIVTGVIGYFLPKAFDTALPWLSENPLSQYPLETVGIAVAASLIGFWTGTEWLGAMNKQERGKTICEGDNMFDGSNLKKRNP